VPEKRDRPDALQGSEGKHISFYGRGALFTRIEDTNELFIT